MWRFEGNEIVPDMSWDKWANEVEICYLLANLSQKYLDGAFMLKLREHNVKPFQFLVEIRKFKKWNYWNHSWSTIKRDFMGEKKYWFQALKVNVFQGTKLITYKTINHQTDSTQIQLKQTPRCNIYNRWTDKCSY